ncbi:DinB family protein [Streptomyces sp. NPDC057438]|uniref:DinB family protein n=1 Tax=Streptomyces sp. NPDC057438 TaxID=3346133 RepID=UPI0036739989
MTTAAPHAKADLRFYLQSARDALLWKLDGLSEYDVRRPLTPTGTNLLGLVKHAAGVELGYLGDTFGRPSGEPLPWLDSDAEANADMWATADESRADVVGLYRRAWAHADATLDALPLDTVGRVPWWADGPPGTRRRGGRAKCLTRPDGQAVPFRVRRPALPEQAVIPAEYALPGTGPPPYGCRMTAGSASRREWIGCPASE